VIPIAAVIGAATAAGFGAEHRWRESASLVAQRLMWTVLWVLMPFVAFFNVASLHLNAHVGAGIAFGYVATFVTLGAAWLVGSRVLKLPRGSVGTLMGVSSFGNTGYLGIPFTAALLGFGQVGNAVAYDMLVSTTLLITVGFSIGAGFGSVGSAPRERVAAFFTRNPPLVATVLGLLAPASLAPDVAVDLSRAVVIAILPIGFFAVGVTLAAEADADRVRFPPPLSPPVAVAVVLKLLLPVAVLFALSRAFISVPDAYLSQAAMAAGINNLVVASEYGLDRRLAAAAIFWTTAIVVAVGVVVALL
jgi:malate permease and related proteins